MVTARRLPPGGVSQRRGGRQDEASRVGARKLVPIITTLLPQRPPDQVSWCVSAGQPAARHTA
jgi:hypothetical protein